MPLKVAIAGLKGHQGTILEGLADLADARLVAVADDDESALAAVSGWGCADEGTTTYTDWREMIDREEIDVLCEAGIDSERHEVVIAATQRGMHCLCEKPLANSLPDLADVRLAVDEAGTHLSMLLTMRFEPCYRLVRKVIHEGGIGEVCLATFQKSYRLGNRPQWQRDKATFSGIIPFIGIHALDTTRWATGREFVEVFGTCSNVGHPELRDMEDQGQVLCKLDNGGSASARLDYCRPSEATTHGDDRLRVAGSHGVIESLACGAAVNLVTNDEGPRTLIQDPKPEKQLVNFVRSIRGECDSEVPAADCFHITEVVLKARASSRHGTPYTI